MSIVEIKQSISRLDPRGRREIQSYLLRLKHETDSWKQGAARKIKAMKSGKGTTMSGLESRLRRGR